MDFLSVAALLLWTRVYSGYLVMLNLVLFVKPDEFKLKPGSNQPYIKLWSYVTTGWRQTQTIETCAALFILIPLQR